jgi:hypothetical protein
MAPDCSVPNTRARRPTLRLPEWTWAFVPVDGDGCLPGCSYLKLRDRRSSVSTVRVTDRDDHVHCSADDDLVARDEPVGHALTTESGGRGAAITERKRDVDVADAVNVERADFDDDRVPFPQHHVSGYSD